MKIDCRARVIRVACSSFGLVAVLISRKLDNRHQIKTLLRPLLVSIFGKTFEVWGSKRKTMAHEHGCQVIDNIVFFIYISPVSSFSNDCDEIIITTSSEESAEDDSTPKESKDSNVADKTKRRRTSSVRFSWHEI